MNEFDLDKLKLDYLHKEKISDNGADNIWKR